MPITTLPQVKDASELRTLDVAGLQEQLGLAMKALDLLHIDRTELYEELTDKQKQASEAKNIVDELKNKIKINTNDANKFKERIMVIKKLITAEKE